MNMSTKSLILGYILWAVFNICSSLEPFPNGEGCSVKKIDCVLKAYCNYYYNVDLHQNYDENCETEKLILIEYRYYLPVDVVIQNGTLNPSISNNDLINLIVQSFDCSNNDYGIIPYISGFDNLKHLNMSHNKLTTVQLSNSVDLVFLEDIDLSFNAIESIAVLETEKAYEGLKLLNLSYNFLTNIPETLFYNFKFLTYLNLSNNRILNLNMYTFLGLKNILNLNLADNLIKSLDLSLAKLITLENLNLLGNDLTELTYADLHSLAQLKYINLSNNKISSVESGLFNNMSYLTSINLKNNHLKIIDKDLFSNIKSLKFVDLSHNEIAKLPKRMFKGNNIYFFSVTGNNIQGNLIKGMLEGLGLVDNLDISYQGITSIEDYAFFGIENISELLLNNNKIGNVSNKSFKLLTKLLRLELSHNNISNITFDVEDLVSLEFLSLAYNELTCIRKNHFQYLNKLEFLDLSNNKIITIEEYSFQFQEYLEVLLIDKNQLQGKLAQDTFNGLQALPSLDLAYTSLTIIGNRSFDEMTHLLKINISHGILRDLCYNSFVNTGKLEILDISYNQLTYFNVNTTDLANLKTLMLQNNLIKTLSHEFDMDYIHLQYLDLSYNDLLFIPDIVFRNQSNLEHLDLSHNLNLVINKDFISTAKNLKTLNLSNTKAKYVTFTWNDNLLSELEISNSSIQNISLMNLNELKHLSNLILKHNQVTKLLVGTFTNMSSLYSLDMSYNKIMFLQPGVFKGCDFLHILNISHNLLVDINYGVFRGLTGLSILDISYNLLENLKDEQFYEINSLTNLIVDNNKISDVTIEEFLGSTLKTISIGGNYLPCESLVRLKRQHGNLDITAITLEDNSDHNYYGIICIGGKDKEKKIKRNKNETITTDKDLKILVDIRNILNDIQNNILQGSELINVTNVIANLQNNTIQTDELSNLIHILRNVQNITVPKNELSNLNEMKSIGDNINKEIKQVILQTNSLLERILEILVAKNSFTMSMQTSKPFNKDALNDNSYLIKLKDLENSFIAEKGRIRSEFDNKLLELSKRIDNEQLDVVRENNNMRSPTFTEVCVAIILLILFCCIIFFIYKSKLSHIGNLSLSTRRMTVDIENSNL